MTPHGHAHGRGGRALGIVLALMVAFTVLEAVAGFLTGSLALLADAGHMVSDDLSIALALVAARLARRRPTPERSFGWRRAEILAALANGITLVAISIWIVLEAVRRFDEPPEVLGGWMLAVALAALGVNLGGLAVLGRSRGESLNVEAAFRHVVADTLGSIGAIAAALVIVTTGWTYADPAASVAIAVLVAASAYGILRDSVRILMEAAPRDVDAELVAERMNAHEGVVNVHDLHIWEITSGFPALSAHVLVAPGDDCHARRRELERLLAAEFGIDHTTLQVDHVAPSETISITRA